MARNGLCSRRDAEGWIADGRVQVNGEVLNTPAVKVGPEDEILIDGKPLPQKEKTRLFLYHKPVGLVTSARDEKGRKTVFDDLPGDLPRLISVGRLDLNTEGLLLLTNDGELSRYLELPSTGWSRKYRVRVLGQVNEARLEELKNGITIEDVHYKSIIATLGKFQGANSWIDITLKEGKNREIRRVMEALNLQVNRLIRVSYGPFQLGKLDRSEVREIDEKTLKHQVAKFFKDGA